jgi:hypothetical protein
LRFRIFPINSLLEYTAISKKVSETMMIPTEIGKQ